MGGLSARVDLQFQSLPDGVVRVVDPVSRVVLFFDEVQAAVLQALDGRGAGAIADEVLEDPDAEPVVAKFIERCRALGLTDEDDAATRLARQRETLRRESTQKRERAFVELVERIKQTIPFHRRRLSDLDGVASLRDLPKLPLMGKRELREHFTELLPDGADVLALSEQKEAMLSGTSGTTGERLQVVLDLKARSYHPALPALEPIRGGLDAAKTALFTTPICSGTVCHMGGMRYEDRLTEHTLVLNSSDRVMRLQRSELESVVEDCQRYQPTIFQCDPVYGLALVRALQREGLPLPKVEVVWTTYEFCSRLHREALAQAFGVPVFDSYGATDAGGGHSVFECERGHYHVREEAFLVELLRDGRPVGEGELGELTVTTLKHRFMPVVRYRSGDLARALPTGECSHSHWQALSLEGRVKDMLRTSDGRLVTPRQVDEQFAGVSCLDFYQLIQRSVDDYELLGVKRPGGDEKEMQLVIDRLERLLQAKVRLRLVREISAEKSLKFRLTVPQKERELAEW